MPRSKEEITREKDYLWAQMRRLPETWLSASDWAERAGLTPGLAARYLNGALQQLASSPGVHRTGKLFWWKPEPPAAQPPPVLPDYPDLDIEISDTVSVCCRQVTGAAMTQLELRNHLAGYFTPAPETSDPWNLDARINAPAHRRTLMLDLGDGITALAAQYGGPLLEVVELVTRMSRAVGQPVEEPLRLATREDFEQDRRDEDGLAKRILAGVALLLEKATAASPTALEAVASQLAEARESVSRLAQQRDELAEHRNQLNVQRLAAEEKVAQLVQELHELRQWISGEARRLAEHGTPTFGATFGSSNAGHGQGGGGSVPGRGGTTTVVAASGGIGAGGGGGGGWRPSPVIAPGPDADSSAYQ
jgi:hypothetical protein